MDYGRQQRQQQQQHRRHRRHGAYNNIRQGATGSLARMAREQGTRYHQHSKDQTPAFTNIRTALRRLPDIRHHTRISVQRNHGQTGGTVRANKAKQKKHSNQRSRRNDMTTIANPTDQDQTDKNIYSRHTQHSQHSSAGSCRITLSLTQTSLKLALPAHRVRACLFRVEQRVLVSGRQQRQHQPQWQTQPRDNCADSTAIRNGLGASWCIFYDRPSDLCTEYRVPWVPCPALCCLSAPEHQPASWTPHGTFVNGSMRPISRIFCPYAALLRLFFSLLSLAISVIDPRIDAIGILPLSSLRCMRGLLPPALSSKSMVHSHHLAMSGIIWIVDNLLEVRECLIVLISLLLFLYSLLSCHCVLWAVLFGYWSLAPQQEPGPLECVRGHPFHTKALRKPLHVSISSAFRPLRDGPTQRAQ